MSGILKKILYDDPITEEDVRELHASFTQMEQALLKCGDAFAHLLQPVRVAREAILQFHEQAEQLIREAYTDAGQPYGPSDAAMYQWFADVAEELQEQEKAKCEIAWQNALQKLRQ